MIFEDKRISYEEMQRRANRLANALEELGVSSGDRVAMLNVNCNQHIEAYFATAKLDAVYVPLNFRARAEELAYMVNDSGAKVLFFGERYEGLVKDCAPQIETVQHYIAIEQPADNALYYEALVESASEDESFVVQDSHDIRGQAYFLRGDATQGQPPGQRP